MKRYTGEERERVIKRYEQKMYNSLGRPYYEFWKLIVKSGQAMKANYLEHVNMAMQQIVNLLKDRKIFIKYQVYDMNTGVLLGFFDPKKVYNGMYVFGKYYRQNKNTINVLVLTKIRSDTIHQDQKSKIKQLTMVRKDITEKLPTYELYA